MDVETTHRFARHWREIASTFLKLGFLSYGGPAILGVMQAELQEKRNWLTKQDFLEGLSLVNVLPGAGATQLGIFLGYTRGGWWGGLLAGLCFVLPAFFIMWVLTLAYSAFGSTPLLRQALYGLSPVVLAIFFVAVYRLGKSAVSTWTQVGIAVSAVLIALYTTLGIATILLAAAAVGLFLFYSRRVGIIVVVLVTSAAALMMSTSILPNAAGATSGPYRVVDVGAFFFKVGALTFGGGLSMLAFVQEQVVNQFHWLTPQEFIDGLALGQLTPGPILMVAAYVGYKVAGFGGAATGAAAIFLPSFLLMLTILPLFNKAKNLVWMRAMMKGISPAVIGILLVSLIELTPHAVRDSFSGFIFAAAVGILLVWRTGTLRLMAAGALVGLIRGRVQWLLGLRSG